MNLALGRAAGKSLDKLERAEQIKIKHGLDVLRLIPPQPAGCKHLSGHPKWYRIRVGVYRICYKIADGDVHVGVIAHRREVYKDLTRVNS
jgi:mRNA interferase RelE/StbE